MCNPFCEGSGEDLQETELIRSATDGDRSALEKLIVLHQAWIFNVAFKMVPNMTDAEDITQEILIKMITHLSSFDPEKAAFRTWLYRITANHVINMKRRKKELAVINIDQSEMFIDWINQIPDQKLSLRSDYRSLLKEAKAECLNGLLLCLDRRQRLVFILGSIFNATTSVGSEITGLSEVNFRQTLSRARKKIVNFLGNNCGLVDEKNSCRCSLFLNAKVGQNGVRSVTSTDEKRGVKTISEVTHSKRHSLQDDQDQTFDRLFRDQPFHESVDFSAWLRRTVESQDFKDLYQLH